MDRRQHIVQDAAEHYAVYLMQSTAEQMGAAGKLPSRLRHEEFLGYLEKVSLSLGEFTSGKYGKYKENADEQVPAFVRRLTGYFPGRGLDFENVEREYRNLGLKADFLIAVDGLSSPIPVSLKNYIGTGGIGRPQVASGTFASFAASFVFERTGVGMYADPRFPDRSFRGNDIATRNAVLAIIGRSALVPFLSVLDDLQAQVRREFLGPECEMYEPARVRAAVERIAGAGIDACLSVLEAVGIETVREIFLSRIGLDGKEEALFFDSNRYVDSITNKRYHELRQELNSIDTQFIVAKHKQAIRFTFQSAGRTVLATDAPFTINTNGAWYRPSPAYEGYETYNDKGHDVRLLWGQRRPYKSKEIATSVNTYVNLERVGIFG